MEVKARMVSSVPMESEGPLSEVSGFCIVILLQIDTTRRWGIAWNFFIPHREQCLGQAHHQHPGCGNSPSTECHDDNTRHKTQFHADELQTGIFVNGPVLGRRGVWRVAAEKLNLCSANPTIAT